MLPEANQRRSLVASIVTLFALTAPATVFAGSFDIAAVGAIEKTNCRARTVTVLGITFEARDAEGIAAVCGANSLAGLPYVSITGRIGADSAVRLTKLVTLSVGQYVPGATQVYLMGPVSLSRSSVGTVDISGATVSLDRSDVVAGDIVETHGIQPVLGGGLLPVVVRVTSLDSSIGSGASTNSSIGSGKSTNSSIGSGSSTNSSIGSGLSTNSSIGSGKNLNSSIGSGKSTNSSIGSGASANSSIGSGKSTNSSIGSGASVNSSIGSGASTSSSIGSGVAVNSSIGSGKSINSSIGSG